MTAVSHMTTRDIRERHSTNINIVVQDSDGIQLAAYSIGDIADPDAAAERVIKAVRLEFREKRASYNFATMSVGEVRVIKTDDPAKVMSAASMYGRRHGKSYKCQRLSTGDVRVTRMVDPK